MFGKASSFYTRLYENGLINQSFSFGYEGHTNFGFCEIAGYSQQPDEVYALILEEIEKYRKNGFDRNDFERIKRVFYASNIRVFNSTEEISNEFLTCIFRGYDMLDYPEIISSVTFEDVLQRFEKTFSGDRIVLSKILPL